MSEVFFCQGCGHFRAAEKAVNVDIVHFVPVPKFKRPQLQAGSWGLSNLGDVSWRRETAPMLLCWECAPNT